MKQILFTFFLLLSFPALAQETFLGLTSDGGLYNNGGVFRMNEDGSDFYSGHFFEAPLIRPVGSILMHSNGNLYGVTEWGGKYNAGAIYSIDPTNSEYSVIFDFEEDVTGGGPSAGLTEGENGVLYGVLEQGANSGSGGIFQVNSDGSEYSLIYEFSNVEEAGSKGKLLLSDGSLYGTLESGGTDYAGTIYRITIGDNSLSILHDFSSGGPTSPTSTLVEHPNGKLYGTTESGGVGMGGVIFRIGKDGSAYEELVEFDQGLDGRQPQSPLLIDDQGNIFGELLGGGPLNGGRLFSCDSVGNGLLFLHDFEFTDVTNQFYPSGGLLKGQDGKLYGNCSSYFWNPFLAGSIFRMNSDGTGFETLKLLSSETGSFPLHTLAQGNDGSIYGVTREGGVDDKGVLFQLDPSTSAYSILLDLALTSEGLEPQGNLILASNNQTYGVTSLGGKFGRGVIFTTDEFGGNYEIVHSFNGSEGASPAGTLLEGADGYLYGVTTEGGSAGLGVVFKFDVAGNSYTLLHEFDSVSTSHPTFGLVQLPDGTLLGTTPQANFFDPGTLYSLQPDGSNFTVIDTFETSGQPYGLPLLHSNGRIYGSSFAGVWQYLPAEDSIQVFSPRLGAGALLLEGSDQMIYGMTSNGGSSDGGTIFKFNPDGTGYTVIHSFDLYNGSYPTGGLIEKSDGLLYGMTSRGGTPLVNGPGTIFRIAKDGTGYEVIKFLNNGLGTEPTGNLLVVPGTNSITSPLASFSVSIFPNPTRDRITIRTDIETGGTIQLVDMQGRTLLQQPLAIRETRTTLDLSGFPAGTYIISVTSGADVARKKVVKW